MQNKSTTLEKPNCSLTQKSDSHLRVFSSYVEHKENLIVVNGYVYVDYIIEDFGALFYFVKFEDYINDTFCPKNDVIEYPVDFENQIITFDVFDHVRGSILREMSVEVDPYDEAFDENAALADAEVKAFEFITNL